jgi:hypothetical protein
VFGWRSTTPVGAHLPLRPVVLALIVGALVELGGHLWFYGLARFEGAVLSAVLAAAVVAAAVAWLLPVPAAEPRQAPRWLWRALSLLPVVLLVDAVWGNPVARELTWGWQPWVAMAAALALVAAPGVLGLRPLWVGVAALMAGVALRAALIQESQINHTGDMLQLVRDAAGRLLEGKSPYATYEMPWPLPLTYLPVTLLAYLPAEAAGIDVRWVNVLADLALAAVVVRAAATARAPGRAIADDPVWLLLAAWFLLPSAVEWSRYTTAPVTWVALAIAVAAVTAGHRLAPVALGVALATTPLAVVLAPLVVLAWRTRHGLGAALLRLGAAALVAAAFIVPFAAWAPGPFVEGTVLWFNDLDRYPRQKWVGARTWREYTGFAGLFWEHGLERWLKPLQATAVVACVAAYFRRGGRLAALPAAAVATFLVFMVWNPVIWPYYYAPAAVLALLAAVYNDIKT